MVEDSQAEDVAVRTPADAHRVEPDTALAAEKARELDEKGS